MIILTCVYNRPEIFQRFLDNLPDYTLVVVGDIQDPCYQLCCNRANTYFVEHQNKPLGKKFNTGLKFVKDNLDCEYIFITGSDDVYEPRLFDIYEQSQCHYTGLLDLYFYDHNLYYYPGFSRDRKGEPMGAGRMLHSTVLDALDWQLWDDNINYSLDRSMTKKLNSIMGITTNFINLAANDLFACDIKSSENIWQIKDYNGCKFVDKSLLKRVC